MMLARPDEALGLALLFAHRHGPLVPIADAASWVGQSRTEWRQAVSMAVPFVAKLDSPRVLGRAHYGYAVDDHPGTEADTTKSRAALRLVGRQIQDPKWK
jgi:hypothetical protein